MSNLSLKEQLQALSVVPSSSSPSDDRNKKKPKAQKQKPVWLEHAQYGVELLKAYFPDCFKETKEIKPLKIGIKQDLVKRLGSIDSIVTADKSCMIGSLAYYVNSVSYHKSVVAGAMRIDLDGVAAGAVTEEEARYSAECCQSKLEKKSKAAHKNNPKPHAGK